LKDEQEQLVGVSTSNLLIANSGNDLPVSKMSNDICYLAKLCILAYDIGSFI